MVCGRPYLFGVCMKTVKRKSRSNWNYVLGILVVTVVFASLSWTLESPRTADLLVDRPTTNAAFVYSVAQFTKWPKSAFSDSASPLVFCSYRDRMTGKRLAEQLVGKTIMGHGLVYRDVVLETELKSCHVVFFPQAGLKQNPPLQACRSFGVLTISDSKEFVHFGGILGFTLRPSGPEINVNPQALRESGLRISPGLLKLAETPETNPRSDGVGPEVNN